jgi:thiamine biosynthesis lipoprotein
MSRRSETAMGTVVTMEVVRDTDESAEALDRAFDWFREIEERCTRFSPNSELMRLCAQPGVAVEASPILFEIVQFAVMVAEETGGAFDPTVGHRMEARGFNREHRSGEVVHTGIAAEAGVSYRDIRLDAKRSTIKLNRPLMLDLGAIAKGFAIDIAARELAECRDFAIDAGGDLFLGGRNAEGKPWSVGIRHPRQDGALIHTLRISGKAVCTSGDYERRTEAGHHILDPKTGESAAAVASATVIAPTAMLADALATSAFVLGPEKAIALLQSVEVEGLILTPDLKRFETKGFARAS